VAITVDVTVEIEIARPPSDVWAFVMDTNRLPDWLEEFESAGRVSDGPIGVGTVIEYTLQPGHRSGTYEIVEWVPERRMAWDGPPLRWAGGGARPRGSFELREAGAGTLFVGRFQPELTGTQVLLKPYLTWWLRRQRREGFKTLRTLVEEGPRR
jgi:uncharacterized protein YndB with AHSA1/START domain